MNLEPSLLRCRPVAAILRRSSIVLILRYSQNGTSPTLLAIPLLPRPLSHIFPLCLHLPPTVPRYPRRPFVFVTETVTLDIGHRPSSTATAPRRGIARSGASGARGLPLVSPGTLEAPRPSRADLNLYLRSFTPYWDVLLATAKSLVLDITSSDIKVDLTTVSAAFSTIYRYRPRPRSPPRILTGSSAVFTAKVMISASPSMALTLR